jgi:hypothetical protein
LVGLDSNNIELNQKLNSIFKKNDRVTFFKLRNLSTRSININVGLSNDLKEVQKFFPEKGYNYLVKNSDWTELNLKNYVKNLEDYFKEKIIHETLPLLKENNFPQYLIDTIKESPKLQKILSYIHPHDDESISMFIYELHKTHINSRNNEFNSFFYENIFKILKSEKLVKHFDYYFHGIKIIKAYRLNHQSFIRKTSNKLLSAK